ELGLVGTLSDRVESPTSYRDFLDKMDKNFKASLGFRFWNMVNVLQVLSMWPRANEGEGEEKTCYSATPSKIAEVCEATINDFDTTEIDMILEFLTLKSDQMLIVQGQTELCKDLPVWEYYKRHARYSIRPLIRINEIFYWGS